MVQLFNADCLDVLKEIPDESIDLVITDCPYHIISGGCTASNNDSTRKTGGILAYKNNAKYEQEVIENAQKGKLFTHNEIEFCEWMPEIYRIMKQDTHCYIMINPRNLKELQQVAEDNGFIFQQLIVWDKGNVTPNRWYMNAYEMILMLRKGRAKNINNMVTTVFK